MLRTKIERLQAMVDETNGRLTRTNTKIAALSDETAATAGSEAAR